MGNPRRAYAGQVLSAEGAQCMEEAYLLYSSDIQRYIRGILLPSRRYTYQDTEDITNETFLVAADAMALGRYKSMPLCLLYTIAKTRAFNFLRRHSTKREVVLSQLLSEECKSLDDRFAVPLFHSPLPRQDIDLSGKEILYKVEQELGILPEKCKLPLLMYVYTEMSYKDIADAMGVPVGTVRSRINNGRKRLKEEIERKHDIVIVP